MLKEIPEGFVKMDLELTFPKKKRHGIDIPDVFENKILRMLFRDFYIFYTKKELKSFTKLSFYCRPHQETEIAYRMGCYSQSNLDHYNKNYFVNPIHTVPNGFPKCIQIKFPKKK